MLSDKEYSVESTLLYREISSGKTSLLAAHFQSGVFSADVSNFIHAAVLDPKVSLEPLQPESTEYRRGLHKSKHTGKTIRIPC